MKPVLIEARELFAKKGPAADTITEDDAALRFADEYKGRLLYCHDRGSWMLWDGAIWHPEGTGLAFHWARELARELSELNDGKGRAVTGKTSFASGVEKFNRSDPLFARQAHQWDQDELLLGTPGGTLDLRAGRLCQADPEDGITKAVAVVPAETADCPLWLRFLWEATGGDEALIGFLRRWCGYCLTGLTDEHALVFVHGGGGNGKSVFLNTVTGILADYAATAAMDTFTASKFDRHPTELAMLRGARLVTASETEEGRPWAESRIKTITGGDPITARFMRENNFTFRPQFKLMIIGNHRPVLMNVDDAMRRRFNLVPFDNKPDRPDRELETKLCAEWPAILRWMVDGSVEWQETGLLKPPSVEAATAAYFSDQDLFGQWLEDECNVEPGNDHKWASSAELRASWKAYAEKSGENPKDGKWFAATLQARGVASRRTPGARGFAGVCLRTAMTP